MKLCFLCSALSHYEYDDDDSDYRIQKPKEKLPPSVFPSGNGYIEYVWPPQHKLSHSVSPTVRPTSWPNWLYFPIYATSTPRKLLSDSVQQQFCFYHVSGVL